MTSSLGSDAINLTTLRSREVPFRSTRWDGFPGKGPWSNAHAPIGVVSWSTGPNMSDGCGGLTGVTPLTLYRGWIVETARKLGSAVGP